MTAIVTATPRGVPAAAAHRNHARIRGIGERAVATLKTWKILTKLRRCPRRTTAIVRAVLALHAVETDHYSG